MSYQFDRKLLRLVQEWQNAPLKTDDLVNAATDEELWGALACLDEMEFEKVRRENPGLERKCRIELERRGRLTVAQREELKELRTTQRWLFGFLISAAIAAVVALLRR
jgi:hypothetical protein